MGNQLVWQERYNVGVDIIDREHKKLFSILNKLFGSSGNQGDGKWVYQEGIKYFKNHAMKHFSEEEVYMASIDYMGFETHRRIHDNFRQKTLPALEKELERTCYSEDAVSHFMGVCAGWLIGHTLTEDRAIAGKSVSKWVNLLPEEEQEALGKTIIRLLNDMFGLDSRIISSHYGGEKFGKGIYYRLVYTSKQGGKWEVMMVFEEKLLLNTIGKMMGVRKESVDTMLVNATRYAAQQFVNCISECFPSEGLLEMKEENLLTYDQFKMEFAAEKPQCSLLFDTGAGYYAYCAIVSDRPQQSSGASITAENAMAEIGKYLSKDLGKEKKAQKGKILLVDDSKVALQAMKELLQDDYEVALAQSGFSAIRCITLDRPDLVLLDYNMPVCDGMQVLEMIRSEEEIADIPVVFLTGRVDRESVSKAMTLKPMGYLSKNTKPAEIKKNVDEFFAKITAAAAGT